MTKKSLARVRTEVVSENILGKLPGGPRALAVPAGFVLVRKADLELLAKVLRRLRWDDQGGYVGYRGDGKWDFVSVGLQAEPKELTALFRLAGVVPDVIVSLGGCSDCAHAINGREQGYRGPCLTCKRPKMSNFVPAEKLKKRAA
jgi:hypothetical protein